MQQPDETTWNALSQRYQALSRRTLRDLFHQDPQRAQRFSVEVGDLFIDYSKNLVDEPTMQLLDDLARHCHVAERFAAMTNGAHINSTEDRAVLHTALRRPRTDTLVVDGVDVVAQVHHVLDRMSGFCEDVRDGSRTGSTGLRFRTMINIGIGGSHLGPAMATAALRPFWNPGVEIRFVSNVDGDDIGDALSDIDPATTLFIVASKTFTTVETLMNAQSARQWIVEHLGEDAVPHHFVAVSTNAEEVTRFGIDAANDMFEFWDWVGGRYSVGSAIGLALMVAIGSDHFRDMLDGMHTIDRYVGETPTESNAAVILAMIGLWYRNICGYDTKAVLPYSHHLALLPAYLQQLDMESNGKSVRLDGADVDRATGPILWGSAGTNGQHAYYQLLHQGTSVVPTDFIGCIRPTHGRAEHHRLLMANFVAQTEALAFGKTEREALDDGVVPELAPHRSFAGNRPSTSILCSQLTPNVLGQLIALYEHIVFVQGTVWNINSFDQWGVELGKKLATRIQEELDNDALHDGAVPHDSSTLQLLDRLGST